ncbi:MAG: DinB family protein [Chloroflexi bacterium]|nr:DinB family protein [Chloroflexota bacterium]
MDTNEYLTHFIGNLNRQYEEALADLTDAQLYFLPNDQCCHIAWHAWHWVRTQDNIVNFICQDRKPPVWTRQGLPEKWGLPKVAQGTGMERAEALALRLPGRDAFLQYLRDVWADAEPYLGKVSAAELQTLTRVNPFGERPKLQHIGQTIIAHGNGHLGQIIALRSVQGLRGDPF